MRTPHLPSYLPGPDMTPMIDCVFLLMIFFMVTTDIGTDTPREMHLPDSVSATAADEAALSRTLVVDIVSGPVESGMLPILLDGRAVSSLEDLRAELRRRSDPRRFPDRAAAVIPGTTMRPSARTLRIRCDRVQLWGWVNAVMELCTLRRGVPLEAELEASPLLRHIEIAVLQPGAGK